MDGGVGGSELFMGSGGQPQETWPVHRHMSMGGNSRGPQFRGAVPLSEKLFSYLLLKSFSEILKEGLMVNLNFLRIKHFTPPSSSPTNPCLAYWAPSHSLPLPHLPPPHPPCQPFRTVVFQNCLKVQSSKNWFPGPGR